MAGLTGLSGLAGYQVLIDDESQASPAERSGDTVDPRHGKPGSIDPRRPWQSQLTQAADQAGPYGPDNQLLGDEFWFIQPAGEMADDPTFDRTPTRRAGPHPKGVLSGPMDAVSPDSIAEQLRQSALLHSVRTGAGLKSLTGLPALNDTWETVDQTNSGHTDLQPIGRQAMSSGFMYGTRDRTHSFARQNEFGFDSSHQWRRYATGPIPGNYMWMRPGGRPMVKGLAGPARPAIGRDSPFYGDNLGAAFSIDGSILQNVPTEYVPPSQPNLAAAPTPATDYGDSVVEWY